MNTPATPPKWGDLLRYTTDDRDITQHQLCIMQGGNGDWYVSIAESPDHHPTNGIRLCTSGGSAHACPGLGRAIAAAYRALYNQAHGIDPDAGPKDDGNDLLEAMRDTMSLDELLADTQANCAQLVEQNLRLIQERNQARQDIADLNTRLIERQQDMMARLIELRNDLRAATRAAINLAHQAIPKEEEDPYQSEDYQRFVAEVAETCQAHDAPCDSCLAGGICDGPNRSHDHDEHISDDDHE